MRVLLICCLVLVGCGDDEKEGRRPGPFRAGVASRSLGAPVGIGTAGFNGIGVSNRTPYADLFGGTRRVHGEPGVKAVALSRGKGYEVIIVRTDQIAVPEPLRQAVVEELRRRVGRDLDDALVMAATHTHAGPGRFMTNEFYSIMVDTLMPAFYLRLVDAIADAVEAALDDLGPARLGHTIASLGTAHADRRCEDLVDHTNDAMPLVVVEKGGEVAAVLVNYAVHGTITGVEELTLSTDVGGAIEEAVADRFGHPVEVLFLDSWAADMSPANPDVVDPGVSAQPGGYDRLERLGLVVADAAEAALQTLRTTDAPRIEARSVRYPISRELMGYPDGEFPYEYGAVFCGVSGESCSELRHLDDLDDNCIAFTRGDPAPPQSLVTVGRVGGLALVTWGGEVTTGMAEAAVAELTARDDVGDVLFVGYANDYLGYQTTYDDWWHGGYEASGSLWGPRQGEYMKRRLLDAFARFEDGKRLPFTEPAPPPIDAVEAEPVTPETAVGAGVVVTEPDASYPRDGVATLIVNGGDPWLGTPRAVLERDDGAGFVEVLRPSGRPYDSSSQAFWIDLEPDPPYGTSAEARRFAWTFSLALARRATPPELAAGGRFRFRVELPVSASERLVINSAAFDVAP